MDQQSDNQISFVVSQPYLEEKMKANRNSLPQLLILNNHHGLGIDSLVKL